MNAALVVMTILGCNDAGTDCHYIATAEERWPTIAMCDAVSDDHLPSYSNRPYPVLIAVCQDPVVAGISESKKQQQAAASPATNAAAPNATDTETAQIDPVSPEEAETLAGRAIQRVRNVLPTTEGVKTLMAKPVRLVEGGYSWVARRFNR
jgi:hypothetical protein